MYPSSVFSSFCSWSFCTLRFCDRTGETEIHCPHVDSLEVLYSEPKSSKLVICNTVALNNAPQFLGVRQLLYHVEFYSKTSNNWSLWSCYMKNMSKQQLFHKLFWPCRPYLTPDRGKLSTEHWFSIFPLQKLQGKKFKKWEVILTSTHMYSKCVSKFK